MLTIDYSYGVLCRHCNEKVIDPDKKSKQKYLEDSCPMCGKDGSDPVETPKKTKKKNAKN